MIDTLAEARAAVETWRASLAVRETCCAACGHDTDPVREPTIRQLTVLYAYVALGVQKQAAAALCIEGNTIKGHLTDVYHRTGAHSIVQAAYLLGAGEWEGR